MQTEAESAKDAPKVTIKELFSPVFIKRTLLSIMVMAVLPFCGSPAIFYYSTSIFEQAGLSIDLSRYVTIGLGLIMFSQTVLSGQLTESNRFGRRSLQLIGLTGVLLANFGMWCSMSLTVRGFLGFFSKNNQICVFLAIFSKKFRTIPRIMWSKKLGHMVAYCFLLFSYSFIILDPA